MGLVGLHVRVADLHPDAMIHWDVHTHDAYKMACLIDATYYTMAYGVGDGGPMGSRPVSCTTTLAPARAHKAPSYAASTLKACPPTSLGSSWLLSRPASLDRLAASKMRGSVRRRSEAASNKARRARSQRERRGKNEGSLARMVEGRRRHQMREGHRKRGGRLTCSALTSASRAGPASEVARRRWLSAIIFCKSHNTCAFTSGDSADSDTSACTC